jgi:hypothetical protein
MDEETPPVRRLALKPKEDVAPTDPAARTGDGTAISVKLMHEVNWIAANKAAVPPRDPFLAPKDGEAISVHEMLQENLDATAEIDQGPIALPAPRRSRRTRDMLLVLACAGAASATLAFVFRANPQVMGLGLLAVGFGTAIMAWILYGVMDHY